MVLNETAAAAAANSSQVIRSPFQMNYQDLLAFLGLSHPQFLILLLFLITVFGFLVMLYKMGLLFHRHIFTRQQQPRTPVVYTYYQGDYVSIGPTFERLRNHMKGYFKRSQMFGIYYDNPAVIEDKTTCRAVVGLLIDNSEVHRVRVFLQHYNSYSSGTMSECEIVNTNFPFFNNISFMLLPTVVYPRLKKYLSLNNLEKCLSGGVMEHYDLVNDRIQVKVAVSANLKGPFWLLPEDQEPGVFLQTDKDPEAPNKKKSS